MTTNVQNISKYPLLLLIGYLTLCLTVEAQEIRLSGAIVIDKTEVMSYSIAYQVDANNMLSGYSIGDLQGTEETKALIGGTYNPKDRTLIFEEKKIVSTQSETPVDEFCLMKVTGKFEKKGGTSIFTGKFDAFSSSNEVICASGTLVLMTEKDIDKLTSQAVKMIKNTPKLKEVDSEQEIKPDADTTSWSRRVIELEAGKTIELELKSDHLVLELIDDRFQDGDKVSVFKNGVKIINSLEIINRVQSFKYVIDKKEQLTTFTFLAEEEGSIALTTFKAVIKNGRENIVILTSLNKGESVKVVFKKK